MAVYFVYRCDENGSSDFFRRTFEVGTLLDWFRHEWRPISYLAGAFEYARGVLRMSIPDFGFFFDHIHESGSPPPTTIDDVRRALLSLDHVAASTFEEHCVQLLTDFDGHSDRVCYFFDDPFVEAHPDLTAYLLHDGPLPGGAGPPGWRPSCATLDKLAPTLQTPGEGRLYVLPQFRYEGGTYGGLRENNIVPLDGMHLSGFCRHLMRLSAEEAGNLHDRFVAVRQHLLTVDFAGPPLEKEFVRALQADPTDEATWCAYADWLTEHDQPGPGLRLLRGAFDELTGPEGGDPALNIVHLGEHFVQASIHAGGPDAFDNLILFDDLWGAAHPVLADALLRYFTRWDILSTGERRFD